MKLPGQLDFGVQSLGRPDTAAMRDKYNSKGQAALAWGKALSDTGNAVNSIAIATANADAAQTLSERVAQDKRSTAELDAWLATNQSFDTMATPLPDPESGASAPVVPEAVLRAAEKLGLSGRVDVYEIAVLASKEHLDASTTASMEAMGEKHNAKQAITKYNQQMDTAWARSASSATQVHTIKRIEHLAARADVSYTAAINDLDEESAAQIIVESEQSGIWTPEYAGAKLAALGSTIDQVAATRMYRDAITQGDLDLADEFTDQSRIDPSSRMAMMKLSDQQQDRQYQIELRKQPVNYGKAQARLIAGTLTKEQVMTMAETNEISGAHANTLRLALEDPTRTTSDPKIVSDLRGEIALLRFPDTGRMGDSTTERARVMRDQLRTAFTGIDKSGNFIGKTLAGNDFEELMGVVDEYENATLGKGGQSYATAVKTIKALTGYSDAINSRIEGPYPAGQAYAAFTLALQDHMDTMGTQANPTEFIARNSQHYTADIYTQKIGVRLSQRFKKYADLITKVINREPISSVMVPDYVPTAATVLNQARSDMWDNKITPEEFGELRRSLQFLELGDAAEETPTDIQTFTGIGG